jgi:hypothetical protein
MERDRYKDAKLLVKGIRTLRVTDTRFELDPRGVFGDVVAALGLARAREPQRGPRQRPR